MERPTALILLENLLSRLEADANSDRPVFGGLVGVADRQALKVLLASEDGPPSPVPEPAAQTSPSAGGASSGQARPVRLNEECLSLTESPDPGYVLCLDFGTAKSKAFAASTDEEEPKLIELALGTEGAERDGSVYAVSSSVWISDDGLMFAGAEAVQRGLLRVQRGAGDRRRLDSLKQELSQIEDEHTIKHRQLEADLNPTGLQLTYDDAITFYLAYLTDLACTQLEARGRSRYVRRRFTLPWWRQEQRAWATPFLRERVLRAQVVADTFHGRWVGGIPAAEAKDALTRVSGVEKKLTWLLDEESGNGHGSLLEPLAAGSGRIWQDRATRDVVLVIDVGAGTTDFALFWVVQDGEVRRAFPIEPSGTAIRMAGDQLDSVLVKELMERAHLGEDPGLKLRVQASLVTAVRQLKEQLFTTGALTHQLPNDLVVSLSRDEFLQASGVTAFTGQVEVALEQFLGKVDGTWVKAARSRGAVSVVLTGGGATLPMIERLADRSWKVANEWVPLKLAPRLPKLVEEEFDAVFAAEYPKLAVALGGALPQRLDERTAQKEWKGGESKPGPLSQYQTKGL
jgi:molecular chaperone HscA